MFRTFDHYYDNDQKVTVKQIEIIEEECFICYEIKLEDKIEPITLKTQILYLKNCECDGTIHIKCLDTWFNLNHTCPICRNYITKNDCYIIKIMNCHKIFILTYIFYKKYIYKIKKILFTIFTICIIIEFYLNILNVKYNNKYYNENDDFYHYNNFVNSYPHINHIVLLNYSSKMTPNYHS